MRRMPEDPRLDPDYGQRNVVFRCENCGCGLVEEDVYYALPSGKSVMVFCKACASRWLDDQRRVV